MTDLSELNLTLPYITEDLPGIGGLVKFKPEYFVVEEIPLYMPCGQGEHLYVNITKTKMTTRDIQVGLAELFELMPEDVGKAGLKDKYAVSTQTLSINLSNKHMRPEEASRLIEDQMKVKVNWARYHVNKLRSGHLKGNRFTITITNIEEPMNRVLEKMDNIASRLVKVGLPNYYGEQRTGQNGDNIRSGWEILTGKKKIHDRWLNRYLLSSYQSYLCNRYLAERIRRGFFGILLQGDIAKKYETGGLFTVSDLITEQKRYEAKEISFTAPMYGYKMLKSQGEAAELENQVIGEAGITEEQLRKHRVKGTRRMGRLFAEPSYVEVAEGVKLNFTLPIGGYATILLREFMKTN
jgi:tRNA pseudouridine13 synthase